MQPDKIVFLSPVGVLGGAERSLIDLIRSLRACAPQVKPVLLTAAEGPLLREVAELGAEARVVPMPDSLTSMGDSELPGLEALLRSSEWRRRPVGITVDLALYLRRLREAIERERPSIVHSNGLKTHLVAALVRPTAPVVWHVRDFIRDRPVIRSALRLMDRIPVCAVGNSRAVAADIRAALPNIPVEVVYNGIDVDHFRPDSPRGEWLDEVAGMSPVPDGALRVGLVSTYARWKGQELFLQAIAHYSARFGLMPAVRFFIVGGPIYRTMTAQYSEQELRQAANRVGVADRVGFVPFQEDPRDVYRSLDIVVHSSIRPEPFGRTIAEAMASGRPTIVSKAGGAAELVRDGFDGCVFEQGSVQGLAETIRALVTRPDFRQTLAKNARETAVQRFSAARLGPEILGVYRRSLEKIAIAS